MSKYLDFEHACDSPSGKTQIWHVRSKSNGVILGAIRWHGPWRCYAFWPSGSRLFNADCLRSIAEVCADLTTEHKR